MFKSVLSIRGGPPVAKREDWPQWPRSFKSTEAAVTGALRSGRWSISGFRRHPGANLERQFAQQFAAFHDVKHAIPTANGTASLTIALQALEIQPGDEVIVPGLVWVAPAVAVLAVNAVPVLVDVDPHTLCLDPAAVDRAITPRTRAIIVVHLYCSMADLDALQAIANHHGIPLIEDCAQTHGSVWNDRRAGTLGSVGIFSLHEGKPLACGEGGIAITNDDELASRMERLRANGRSYRPFTETNTFDLEEVGGVLGTNYAMSELQAALALDSLSRLEAENDLRAANAARLDRSLARLPGITPITRPAPVKRQTYYHYALHLDRSTLADRSISSICRALQSELNFWIHPPYVPLNRNLLYQPQSQPHRWWDDHYRSRIDPCQFHLPAAEHAHQNALVFHHSILLAEDAGMAKIEEAFAKVLGRAEEIPE